MVLEPGVATWKVQTKSLSYGGTSTCIGLTYEYQIMYRYSLHMSVQVLPPPCRYRCSLSHVGIGTPSPMQVQVLPLPCRYRYSLPNVGIGTTSPMKVQEWAEDAGLNNTLNCAFSNCIHCAFCEVHLLHNILMKHETQVMNVIHYLLLKACSDLCNLLHKTQ